MKYITTLILSLFALTFIPQPGSANETPIRFKKPDCNILIAGEFVQTANLSFLNVTNLQGKFYLAGRRVFRHPFWGDDITELTRSFEIMEAPVNRESWRTIATLHNHYFPNGPQINPEPANFRDKLSLPAENMKWSELKLWIATLNDLSQRGVTELEDIIKGHKPGDRYRLPAEDEWYFSASGHENFVAFKNFYELTLRASQSLISPDANLLELANNLQSGQVIFRFANRNGNSVDETRSLELSPRAGEESVFEDGLGFRLVRETGSNE